MMKTAENAARVRARRAVSKADKTQRRDTILQAADAQMYAVGIDAFSMEVLARELGFARGTLYRYFATREELLLELTVQKRDIWTADLIAAVSSGMTDAQFINVFKACCDSDELHLRLSGRLESVIEQNVTLECYILAKQKMHHSLRLLAEHLVDALNLEPTEISHLILVLGALYIGAQQMMMTPPFNPDDLPQELRYAMETAHKQDLFAPNALYILTGLRQENHSR